MSESKWGLIPDLGRKSRISTRDVAVVVPRYRDTLSPEEEISLSHLCHYLSRYDKYFIIPDDLTLGLAGFEVRRFERRHFADVSHYSKLMLAPAFYGAFDSYSYILVYQLDSLVFADELLMWCEAGFDYVGAPWLKDRSAPEKGFLRCGNGGLSLRSVTACQRVLEASGIGTVLRQVRQHAAEIEWNRSRGLPAGIRKALKPDVSARSYVAGYTCNEDRFWSEKAALFDPTFRVAPVREGLRFAFECAPSFCFEMNDCRLPFGCHAWHRYDRRFWEPYLLR